MSKLSLCRANKKDCENLKLTSCLLSIFIKENNGGATSTIAHTQGGRKPYNNGTDNQVEMMGQFVFQALKSQQLTMLSLAKCRPIYNCLSEHISPTPMAMAPFLLPP